MSIAVELWEPAIGHTRFVHLPVMPEAGERFTYGSTIYIAKMIDHHTDRIVVDRVRDVV